MGRCPPGGLRKPPKRTLGSKPARGLPCRLLHAAHAASGPGVLRTARPDLSQLPWASGCNPQGWTWHRVLPTPMCVSGPDACPRAGRRALFPSRSFLGVRVSAPHPRAWGYPRDPQVAAAHVLFTRTVCCPLVRAAQPQPRTKGHRPALQRTGRPLAPGPSASAGSGHLDTGAQGCFLPPSAWWEACSLPNDTFSLSLKLTSTKKPKIRIQKLLRGTQELGQGGEDDLTVSRVPATFTTEAAARCGVLEGPGGSPRRRQGPHARPAGTGLRGAGRPRPRSRPLSVS